MRIGFYPKLALDGIRKNKKLYVPYLLTCIGMVMMYYIIIFLQGSEAVSVMPGGATVQGTLLLGGRVIAVFAGLFLFYTNSFLLRRRKKEFGLYNMLGMGKRHIAVILFWETLLVYLISILIGLAGGVAFSKLAELGLVRVMRGATDFGFSVSLDGIMKTAGVFGLISLLLFVNALRQIRFSTALALLKSETTGEKPPKANWILGIAGILILGAAYAIAVKIQDPVSALLVFFVAVLMVIVGTYLLLIAGSVMLCRILQKNKKYYYKTNHFVSVSSMAYRMKRNGAGLASVCILSTMVLVMISSTASLYVGTKDVVDRRWPRDIDLEFRLDCTDKTLAEETIYEMRTMISETAEEYGALGDNVQDYMELSVGGLLLNNGSVETDTKRADELMSLGMYANVFEFDFMPLEDYNALNDAQETLLEGECLLGGQTAQFTNDILTFEGGRGFRVKKLVPSSGNVTEIQVVTVVVPDLETAVDTVAELMERCGEAPVITWSYNFDTGLDGEKQAPFLNVLNEKVAAKRAAEEMPVVSYYPADRAHEENYQYAFSASFLYLGILLSIVFLFAAVLIIYYKQISEGYEDQARFGIMRKVGMTKREIRKSINSQLLTVFFLPLLLAGTHLAFAFPVIRKLLLLFGLDNFALFAGTTAASFAVFAFFYGLVYRATSNAYYGIVSGAREE